MITAEKKDIYAISIATNVDNRVGKKSWFVYQIKISFFYLNQIFKKFKSDFFLTYDFLKCAIVQDQRTCHVQLRCKKCDRLLLICFLTYYWHRITKARIEEKFHPAAVNICGIISRCWTCIFVILTRSFKTV